MSRRRSVTIDVDGKPVRLCGGTGEMTDEAAAAIADVVRAATRLIEQQPARCLARDAHRVASLPCLREPDHEPPHRNGNGPGVDMSEPDPCRRHHVIGCDIQRCAEDRRGSQRHGMDEGQLEQAAVSVRRLKSARLARQDRRARVDAAYREVAARQPLPSGHSNRHGGSVSVRDGNGR